MNKKYKGNRGHAILHSEFDADLALEEFKEKKYRLKLLVKICDEIADKNYLKKEDVKNFSVDRKHVYEIARRLSKYGPGSYPSLSGMTILVINGERRYLNSNYDHEHLQEYPVNFYRVIWDLSEGNL